MCVYFTSASSILNVCLYKKLRYIYVCNTLNHKQDTRLLFVDMNMKNLIKTFSRLLYGGVSCYCIQRFLMDFMFIKNFDSELLQSGDIIILDIWNCAKLNRYYRFCFDKLHLLAMRWNLVGS